MRSTSGWRRVFVTPSAVALALAGLVAVAQAQQRTPTLAERTGTLPSPPLTESSGVAPSRRFPGVLWTHNDSGDEPLLYAVNLVGELLGRYLVPGARNEDWEDLALARCPTAAHDCLYVADTGDNRDERRQVTLYAVPEPDQRPLPGNPEPEPRLTARARALQVRYPDRPHDVEAIWVDPNGTVELVSKGTSGPVLRFVVPRSAWAHDTATARLADTIPIAPQPAIGQVVTGAAISPSGRRVVIRTYTELFFFRREGNQRLVPDGALCWLGIMEPQGEGVAFLDEDTLVLTSEGVLDRAGSIHRVRC